MLPTRNDEGNRAHLLQGLTAAGLGIAMLWAYWPTFGVMAQKWMHDPQYSHGYLVPAFSAVLLWMRRKELAALPLRFSGWGFAFLGFGVALRLAGTFFYYRWFDEFSLLPTLAGLALLLGGWSMLRVSWPAIAFLAFMFPLPYRVETALAAPLRHVATLVSTYLLQLIGMPALSEGNVIIINETKLGVVDACSGLSMLLIFFALSTAFAMLVRRPTLDKILVVLSAVP